MTRPGLPTSLNLSLHVKTLLTLAVLVVLLFVGITWGWASLTQPFPHKAATKTCYPTTLHAGDRVAPPKVIVTVLNASDRVGLAERTMSDFEDQGFGAGDVGNAPKGTLVHYAQIWAKHRKDPAVQLVSSRLGPHAAIVSKHYAGPGVIVVVGEQFDALVAGKPSTPVTKDYTICAPPTN
ncbi:MAG: LytR C-terminal domain-containing protein [Nocardioides sp.]